MYSEVGVVDVENSGVPPGADQVSGKRNIETETGTLKPETSVFVIWDFSSSSTPRHLAFFTAKPIEL